MMPPLFFWRNILTKKNSNLHAAKRAKNDEFYTQLGDIESELSEYKDHFKGKSVFLNCDSVNSKFWTYFSLNFQHLGLTKLTCVHINLDGSSSEKVELESYDSEPKVTVLKGDGDFRSSESVEILMNSDIVVTNPPFSLFREYVSQLMECNKKFLIVGNQNAITYKEIFPLIRGNKIWLGVTNPKRYTLPCGSISKSFGNHCWFTNLDNSIRNEELFLYKEFDESVYNKFDNYDVINVDKVVDIPVDYFEAMGVPITFLNKYNPSQFEILNCNQYITNENTPQKSHGLIKDKDGSINGKPKYARIVIKRK